MSVEVRVEPLDRSAVLALTEGIDGPAASRALAGFAREQLAEAKAVNARALGRVPDHETYVDGRRSAPLESVRPDGRILFEFDLLLDLFAWIGAQLVEHSPYRTGRYRDSHIFLADGIEMEPGGAVPDAAEYIFLNVQPYARKIERGLSPQAPDGVYEAVALLARRRFGNVASIRFSFRSVLGISALNSWAQSTSLTRSGRRMKEVDRRDWLRRQPAIVIRPGPR